MIQPTWVVISNTVDIYIRPLCGPASVTRRSRSRNLNFGVKIYTANFKKVKVVTMTFYEIQQWWVLIQGAEKKITDQLLNWVLIEIHSGAVEFEVSQPFLYLQCAHDTQSVETITISRLKTNYQDDWFSRDLGEIRAFKQHWHRRKSQTCLQAFLESNKPHFTHNSLLEEKDVGCPYYSPLFNNDNFPTNLALNVPHCHLVPALSAAGTFSG